MGREQRAQKQGRSRLLVPEAGYYLSWRRLTERKHQEKR